MKKWNFVTLKARHCFRICSAVMHRWQQMAPLRTGISSLVGGSSALQRETMGWGLVSCPEFRAGRTVRIVISRLEGPGAALTLHR